MYYFNALSDDGCWSASGVSDSIFIVYLDSNETYILDSLIYDSIIDNPAIVWVSWNVPSNSWSSQNWYKYDTTFQTFTPYVNLMPNQVDNVIIMKGYCVDEPNVVVYDTDTAKVNNIFIGKEGKLTIEDGVVEVMGSMKLANEGKFEMIPSLVKAPDTLKIRMNLIIDSLAQFVHGNGTVVFDKEAKSRLLNFAQAPFYNLKVDKKPLNKSGEEEVRLLTTTTVENELILESGYVNLNKNTLIIENPSNDAIIRNTGYIFAQTIVDPSQQEPFDNILRWKIGDQFDLVDPNENIYTVPFGMATNKYIPLTLDIKRNVMSSDDYIDFSSYATNSEIKPFPLNVPMPFDSSYHGGPYDESDLMVRRFWYVKPSSLTGGEGAQSPIEGKLTMTFDDDMEFPTTGQLPKEYLIAQRYNSDLGLWADVLYTQDPVAYMPIIGGGSHTNSSFTTGYISTSKFYSVWVLTHQHNPLPIELLKFEAECNNGSVDIRWSTATETNNHYFTIEKSNDGNNWQAFATIPGANNSSTQKDYNFTDTNPYDGISFYRLRQTDNNGVSTVYSPVVVTCLNANSPDVVFYPNPFTETLTIMFSNLPSSDLQVEVYDVVGKRVKVKNMINVSNQSGYFTIDLHDLTNGVYFMKFIADDYVKFERITKQR